LGVKRVPFWGGFTIPQKAHVCITAIIPIYIEQNTQKGVKRGSKKRVKKGCFWVLKKSSFLTLLGIPLKRCKKGLKKGLKGSLLVYVEEHPI
jgi:hypothetical protein